MRTWIEELFHQDVSAPSHPRGLQITKDSVQRINPRPVAAVMSNDRFRVRVFHGGHGWGDSVPGEFWLVCDFYTENGWRPVFQLHEVHLVKVRTVLKDVMKFLASQSRKD